MPNNVPWSDETVAMLKELWGQGLSGGIIGIKMNMTRNAIIGKANRLGLEPRATKRQTPSHQGGTFRRHQKKPSGLPQTPPQIEAPPEPPVEGGVSIIDLENHHCRAVIGTGDDGLARFCGASRSTIINRLGQRIDTSYCRSHAGQYYQ